MKTMKQTQGMRKLVFRPAGFKTALLAMLLVATMSPKTFATVTTLDLGQLAELVSATATMGSQLTEMTKTSGASEQTAGLTADILKTTTATLGNIGSVAAQNLAQGQALQGLLSSASANAQNIFGGNLDNTTDTISSAASALTGVTGAASTVSGLASAASAAAAANVPTDGLAAALNSLGKLPEFYTKQAQSLYDIYNNSASLVGQVKGLAENPSPEAIKDLITGLLGGTSGTLKNMTVADMEGSGTTTVAGALMSDLNVKLIEAAAQADDRYSARMARLAVLEAALTNAQDLSSVTTIQALISQEIAEIQTDNLSVQEANNAASAARAMAEAAQRREMQIMMRNKLRMLHGY